MAESNAHPKKDFNIDRDKIPPEEQEQTFNPILDGRFRAAHGWGGGAKEATLPKICDTYPIMMKTCTVIPYLEEIRKQNGPRDTP